MSCSEKSSNFSKKSNLKPFLKYIPQILNDTFDFVNKNANPLPIGTVMGVADIKSLYTNIKHDLGLTATQFWLDKLEHTSPHLKRFSKTFILVALKTVLTLNYFTLIIDISNK